MIELSKQLEAWIEQKEITNLAVVTAELSLRSGDQHLPPRDCVEITRKRMLEAVARADNPYALAFSRILPARTHVRNLVKDGKPGKRMHVPAWMLINTVLVFSNHENPFYRFEHLDHLSTAQADTGPVYGRLRPSLAVVGRIPARFYQPSRLKDFQPWLDLTFKLQQWKSSFELPKLTSSEATGTSRRGPDANAGLDTRMLAERLPDGEELPE